MQILSIAAGAGGMYCGSCLRDNALAAELMARGHQVTLLPLYTPLLTDEKNVTRPEVLFGGISVYLQQQSSLFARIPRFLDRILDAPRFIKAFADRSVSTDPKLLGELTVAMLEGANGPLKKEFAKLLEWTADEPTPDVINLTNSMIIGLAAPLAAAFDRPVCCTLQGEDLFLDSLVEPYRTRAIALIRQHVRHLDRFIAVSDFYARFMSSYLQIPADRISVVPIGINVEGFGEANARASSAPFTVGYFARIAPEKGLHLLADAYLRFRCRIPDGTCRLEVAGYLRAEHKPYLAEVERTFERAGLAHEFSYHGALDRKGKVTFLETLDVLSVPATYDEPKGFPLLEAMAAGVPVVQPRRGSFVEIVDRTRGGLLVEPDNAEDLAEGLHLLWRDADLRRALGRNGREGVREHFTVQRSADRLLDIYERTVHRGPQRLDRPA